MLKKPLCLASALLVLMLGTNGAALAAKRDSSAQADPAATAKIHRHHARVPRKMGNSGSGETAAERDRRLRRECRGLPNAGACLGYGG